MGKFDNYLFHCSSIGEIMTEPRSGKGLSETCKAHLLQCWIGETYGRFKGDTNKYIEKGNMVEEDSITLYSRVAKKLFTKNNETFSNEFITGTPDIIHDSHVVDIKSCWDMFTFFANLHKPLNKDYLYQLNGYWDLLQARSASLVYVLVNTPDVILEQEKSRLRYKMGLIDPESNPVYLHAVAEIDKNGLFDDVPIEKRWIELEVPKLEIAKVYDRVKDCREFLNALS
jgi:hypothetical protein